MVQVYTIVQLHLSLCWTGHRHWLWVLGNVSCQVRRQEGAFRRPSAGYGWVWRLSKAASQLVSNILIVSG